MRKLLLHVGMEKTGTSSLQAFLFENSQRLGDLGIWYPTDPTAPYVEGHAHFPIVSNFISCEADFVSPDKQITREAALMELLTEVKNRTEQTTVLSAEHFSSRLTDVKKLHEFREQIKQSFDVITVIIYLRDQVSLAPSSYSTQIYCGRRSEFSIDEVVPENDFFNVLSILDRWASVFGVSNILAREFNDNSLPGRDICNDFCEILGVNIDLLTKGEERNRSLPIDKINTLRLINQWLPEFHENAEGWWNAQQLRNDYIEPFLVSNSGAKMLLSDREKLTILERFDAQNRLLNEKYFAGSLSERWFSVARDSNSTQTTNRDASIQKVLCRSLIAIAQQLRTVTEANDRLENRIRAQDAKLAVVTHSISMVRGQIDTLVKSLNDLQSHHLDGSIPVSDDLE